MNDPALADSIRQSLVVESIQLPRPHQDANITVGVKGVIVGIGFDVLVRQGGVETPLASLACPARTTNHSFVFGGQWRTGVKGKADIIFRSDPAAAANTVDVFEIWQGEIIFKDVPVQ